MGTLLYWYTGSEAYFFQCRLAHECKQMISYIAEFQYRYDIYYRQACT